MLGGRARRNRLVARGRRLGRGRGFLGWGRSWMRLVEKRGILMLRVRIWERLS